MRTKSEEAILDSALKVFSEKGFHRATNRDIAQEAGIASAGLIYHYFKDKHDLLRAVMLRQAGDTVLGPNNLWPTLPLREGLEELAKSFLRMVGDETYRRVARVALMEAITDPVFGRDMFAMGPARMFVGLQKFLEKGMEDGLLEESDPAILTHVFLGPLIKALLQRVIFSYEDPVSVEAAAEGHVELFLHGCTKSEASRNVKA